MSDRDWRDGVLKLLGDQANGLVQQNDTIHRIIEQYNELSDAAEELKALVESSVEKEAKG